MKNNYGSNCFLHTFHLAQIGHKNILKSILHNWIHTLLEEPEMDTKFTRSHSNKIPENKDSL